MPCGGGRCYWTEDELRPCNQAGEINELAKSVSGFHVQVASNYGVFVRRQKERRAEVISWSFQCQIRKGCFSIILTFEGDRLTDGRDGWRIPDTEYRTGTQANRGTLWTSAVSLSWLKAEYLTSSWLASLVTSSLKRQREKEQELLFQFWPSLQKNWWNRRDRKSWGKETIFFCKLVCHEGKTGPNLTYNIDMVEANSIKITRK